jgi:hypothetical protein
MKSSDYIGIKTKIVTPDMIGSTTKSIFLS